MKRCHQPSSSADRDRQLHKYCRPVSGCFISYAWFQKERDKREKNETRYAGPFRRVAAIHSSQALFILNKASQKKRRRADRYYLWPQRLGSSTADDARCEYKNGAGSARNGNVFRR